MLGMTWARGTIFYGSDVGMKYTCSSVVALLFTVVLTGKAAMKDAGFSKLWYQTLPPLVLVRIPHRTLKFQRQVSHFSHSRAH
jgi:hypothetical protein